MRPMLRRAEYRAFAEKINKRMEWKPYGIEMLTFYAVAIIAPPLAAFLMVSNSVVLIEQTCRAYFLHSFAFL